MCELFLYALFYNLLMLILASFEDKTYISFKNFIKIILIQIIVFIPVLISENMITSIIFIGGNFLAIQIFVLYEEIKLQYF